MHFLPATRYPLPAARTVVITGIGLVTSLGLDRPSTWSAIRRGESGARWLDIPGVEPGHAGFPVVGAAEMGVEADPTLEWLTRAADEAMADARVMGSGLEADRSGVLVGLSKGSVRGLSRVREMVRSGDDDEATLARTWMRSWPGSGAALLAGRYGFRGPCVAPIAACATGLVAATGAADLIRRGACDLALAGGADSSLEPILLAAFRRMKALARVDGDPRRAVRPWDRDRSGFLVGEGGGVLVLERLDHALARGLSLTPSWPAGRSARTPSTSRPSIPTPGAWRS